MCGLIRISQRKTQLRKSCFLVKRCHHSVCVPVCGVTFCGSSGGCSRLSGGLVLRDGWMQTTSWFQPGAPGPGLGGVIGGAQGGAQGGASGGGRGICSRERATSTRSVKKNVCR